MKSLSILLLMRMGDCSRTSDAFTPPLPSSNSFRNAADCSRRLERRGVRVACQELPLQSQLFPWMTLWTASIPLFATPNSKQLARQLYQENLMPPTEEDVIDSNDDSNQPHDVAPTNDLGRYDENQMSPLESEFRSLMSTFLTYSERDIRSLTSTSNRYIHYTMQQNLDRHSLSEPLQHHPIQSAHKPQKRTKEAGIRYRALFDGVQR